MLIRSVIFEHAAASIIDSATSQQARCQDVFDGLFWALAREPLLGVALTKTSDPVMYLLKSEDFTRIGVGIITLIYQFDDDSVTIYGVRREYPGPVV